MKFIETPIEGLWIIEPRVFEDERGFFMETYHQERFIAHGIAGVFVQQNHSRSKRGVLRGLHYQREPFSQGKLIRVVRGEAFDVAVDLRPGSPTFGKWFGTNLSSDNKKLLYIPPGFAHGFCALTDDVDFTYSCTNVYSAAHETGILWNDPDLAISWPLTAPIVSSKDCQLPSFKATAEYKIHITIISKKT